MILSTRRPSKCTGRPPAIRALSQFLKSFWIWSFIWYVTQSIYNGGQPGPHGFQRHFAATNPHLEDDSSSNPPAPGEKKKAGRKPNVPYGSGFWFYFEKYYNNARTDFVGEAWTK